MAQLINKNLLMDVLYVFDSLNHQRMYAIYIQHYHSYDTLNMHDYRPLHHRTNESIDSCMLCFVYIIYVRTRISTRNFSCSIAVVPAHPFSWTISSLFALSSKRGFPFNLLCIMLFSTFHMCKISNPLSMGQCEIRAKPASKAGEVATERHRKKQHHQNYIM